MFYRCLELTYPNGTVLKPSLEMTTTITPRPRPTILPTFKPVQKMDTKETKPVLVTVTEKSSILSSQDVV